ncbi:hypothetical protein SAMN05216464_119100 [Mucilaginibacter pineti]|uniref:Uncharacterized protein n=1 Tax=Mucilaginibacter pineti TaxID=1391627 RepID=A0A1G7LTA8_9SPHI|nr:hypothetical protein [Mucilaginibacter pineti]SDF52778.1 hypothetical protein SAMN05216464_119100 [Mucilaginibacter pineti]
MKLFLKCIIYTLFVICLTASSILLYQAHPEVQLAFIIPGLFILVYSVISDDLGLKRHPSVRLRLTKGR